MNQGFTEETRKSFEWGLDLVEECIDMERATEFHLQLATLLFLKSHGNVAITSLQRCLLEDNIFNLTTQLYKQALDHFREFPKKF